VPRVSVITVVKDDALGLKRTRNSLSVQTFNDWELLVVVAPSSDSTMDIATEFQTIDPRINLLKQTSTGIYQAMNEGIAAAVGDFIWFMNAGDIFTNHETLAHAVEKISKSSTGVLIGGYGILNGNTKQVYSYPAGEISLKDFAFSRRGGCHQAMIFQSSVLRDVGGFETKYLLASDFDLVLRVIKRSGGQRDSRIYASVEPGGRADQGIFLVHKEKHIIRRDLLGGFAVLFASLLWTGLARTKIISRRFWNI
jgi:glycosyltransferase involved in cell wall biosynthesis